MKLKYILPAVVLAAVAFGFSSCTNELHVDNINPQQVSTFDDEAIFNKVYANMVLTGQTGPDGSVDIEGIDEGTSNMLRQIWNANELTTDEAHCVWGDPGIPELNHNAWGDSHTMLNALYYRLMFGVTISNFFLDNVAADTPEHATMRAEVRFLRALYYYYMMDLYGNPPFIDHISSEKPIQYSRAQIFEWIEGELKAVLGEVAEDNSDVLADAALSYGRVSKPAARLLLARLYLNAEVYTGTARWADAKAYAQAVMKDSNLSLCTTGKGGYSAYQLLFMGDNDTNGAQKEIILPAIHDGETTQTWGGCLFIIASTSNDAMVEDYLIGTSEKWGGNVARKQFVEKFFPNNDAPSGIPTAVAEAAGDDRALFFTKGHTSSIEDETSFTNSGYGYVKFLGIHSDGSSPKHTQFVDTDFPMMRLAEAYLTFAEADARLNGNLCTAEGLEAIKAIRSRANATTNFSRFSLAQIEDEWSREFGFEGRRRMDLIRFNHFGGQNEYKWEYMGGVAAGASFSAHLNIFAIPAQDLNANENLKQNPEYNKK
jgi:hypothetical protein